uniref:Ras association domain family member 6 n=1 Tax=Latimeria chalumnae TaxID=7897 RepID=H3A0U0_LATCH
IFRAQFVTLLKTYNCYYEQKNLQLNVSQVDGKIVIEGPLDISWGVQRPIRLKIQDEKQIPSYATIHSPGPTSTFTNKGGMTRWGEFDDLHHIAEMEETQDTVTENPKHNSAVGYDSGTLKPYSKQELDSPSMHRTMSDAALVKKRSKASAASNRQKTQHRFSINGHFYNYKTSVFTPTFGSVTNVRINSNMTTQEVITQLLNKFKMENDPREFALYIIHASGEKKKLKNSDFPLWERLLQGPSGKIAKMFLMDKDAEEISNDVAQYIKFDLPLLQSILLKLNEEEKRETEKIIKKYTAEKNILIQHLFSRRIVKTEDMN